MNINPKTPLFFHKHPEIWKPKEWKYYLVLRENQQHGHYTVSVSPIIRWRGSIDESYPRAVSPEVGREDCVELSIRLNECGTERKYIAER